MMLKEQENVFLFNFGLIAHLEKSYPYLFVFAPIKDFLDVYNAKHPDQT